MKKRYSRSLVALAAICAILPVGCQAVPGLKTAGSDGSNSVMARLTQEHAGSVAVRVGLGMPTAGRTVQATLADIDHIDLTVSQLGEPGAPDVLKSIPKTSVDATGHATALFDFLWPGTATISATVKDSAGRVIGSASAQTIITSGQVSAVSLAIQLIPTEILAGGLSADLTIADGPRVLVTPTPVPIALPPVNMADGTFAVGQSVAGAAATTAYFSQYGITISNLSPGTYLDLFDARFSYNNDPYGNPINGSAMRASSNYNVLVQQGTNNNPAEYTLNFPRPVSQVSFYRAGASLGAASPEWSATAYNGSTAIASVGQGLNGYCCSSPPQLYSFVAGNYGHSQITKLRFYSNNYHFAAFSTVAIDDLNYTPIP